MADDEAADVWDHGGLFSGVSEGVAELGCKKPSSSPSSLDS